MAHGEDLVASGAAGGCARVPSTMSAGSRCPHWRPWTNRLHFKLRLREATGLPETLPLIYPPSPLDGCWGHWAPRKPCPSPAYPIPQDKC